MKKMFVLFAMVTTSAFATDIVYENDSYNPATGTGMCDTNVLQHDSGTVRLRARYEPNQINIRWYNNNTELTPANTAANTCDYDDDLTLPNTQPTRTGYTFAGWRVRPLIDFGSLDLSNPSANYGKGINQNRDYCATYISANNVAFDSNNWHEGSSAFCLSNNNFTELQQQEWKVVYPGGTLYGASHCSAKAGITGEVARTSTTAELDEVEGVKRHCWCKATGWKDLNGTIVKGSLHSLAWVYGNDRSVIASCERACAANCAYFVHFWLDFRAALVVPVN